jgi:hypothetical protein
VPDQHIGRPDWTAHQFAAAVRADAVQPGFRTVGAERALIGADPRLQAGGRKVAVTAFAIWAKLQHLLCRHRDCDGSRQFKRLVSIRGNLIAFLPVGADATDIRHENSRLAGDVGAHVPGRR